MEIITTKVTINGLYSWGLGWDEETRIRWGAFWDGSESKGIIWKPFKKYYGDDEVRNLVSNGSSIYLHPMGFDVVCVKLGHLYGYEDGEKVEYFVEIDELKDILDKMCSALGCSYEIAPVKVHEIEV